MTQDDVRIHINPEVLFCKTLQPCSRPSLHRRKPQAETCFTRFDYEGAQEELLLLNVEAVPPLDDHDLDAFNISLPYWEFDDCEDSMDLWMDY